MVGRQIKSGLEESKQRSACNQAKPANRKESQRRGTRTSQQLPCKPVKAGGLPRPTSMLLHENDRFTAGQPFATGLPRPWECFISSRPRANEVRVQINHAPSCLQVLLSQLCPTQSRQGALAGGAPRQPHGLPRDHPHRNGQAPCRGPTLPLRMLDLFH